MVADALKDVNLLSEMVNGFLQIFIAAPEIFIPLGVVTIGGVALKKFFR